MDTVRTIEPHVNFAVSSEHPDINSVPRNAPAELTIRMDIDQVDWITAEGRVGPISPDLITLTDPRSVQAVPVGIGAAVKDVTGSILSMWPAVDGYTASDDSDQTLYLRTMSADWLTGDLTFTVASRESLMRDNVSISRYPYDTGATNLVQLAEYAAEGGTVLDRMGAGSVSIPAGDRRMLTPGTSMWDLLEPEASAAGGRLFFSTGLNPTPVLAHRNDPPRDTTITRLVMSADPSIDGIPVESVTETRDRDGDWARAIIVQFDYTNSAGDRITEYQTSNPGGGTEATKSLLVNRSRPAPGGNMAAQIVARARLRGQAFTVTGPIDFRVRPGVFLTLERRVSTTDLGMVRSVEYRVHEGRMTVNTQIGDPVDDGASAVAPAPAPVQSVETPEPTTV